LHKKAISQIAFEIEQIDKLLASYSELLHRSQTGTPNLVEITALASVLHSFYNGMENIFLTIAKRIDSQLPQTDRWHRDLLTQMTQATSKRNQVLTNELANRLTDYLGFRHFYRHSYSFFLEWDELEKLVTLLEGLWVDVKVELEAFVDSLRDV
jgi:hypothetical protein